MIPNKSQQQKKSVNRLGERCEIIIGRCHCYSLHIMIYDKLIQVYVSASSPQCVGFNFIHFIKDTRAWKTNYVYKQPVWAAILQHSSATYAALAFKMESPHLKRISNSDRWPVSVSSRV